MLDDVGLNAQLHLGEISRIFIMELAKRFQQSKGSPVRIDGQELYATIERKLEGVKSIQIRRISAGQDPVPGLCLQGYNASFLVNDQNVSNVILWADTSPDIVNIAISSKNGEGEIRIWNCWRDRQGVTQAWLRNAAMKKEVMSDTIKVLCNSGPSGLVFNDLIIEITFD